MKDEIILKNIKDLEYNKDAGSRIRTYEGTKPQDFLHLVCDHPSG